MRAFSSSFHKDSRPQKSNLTDARIASPCAADWEKMAGDDRIRHCSECHLNVYNLSAMTAKEAEDLLVSHSGQRLCTRFYRRADGTILTQDCPRSIRAITRKISRLATAFLTALLSVNLALAKSKLSPVNCECQRTQQKDPGVQLTIRDQQGAVIPGAAITFKKKSGAEEISGNTGPSGEWNLPRITPGEYTLTVQSQGFRTFNSLVVVQDGKLLGLKVTLPLAVANTTVEVTAAMGGVEVGIFDTVRTVSPSPLPPSGFGGQHSPVR